MYGKNRTGEGSPESDPENGQDCQVSGNDRLVQSPTDDRDNDIDPDPVTEAEPMPAEKLLASNASRFSRHSDGQDTPWRRAWLH